MSYKLLSNTTPKAKKEHKCIWCSDKILIGERYNREKSVWDGNMQNHAWHLECLQDCKNETINSSNFEFSPGEYNRPAIHLGFDNA